MASQPSTVPKSVLIINPNTTTEMTDALKPLVDSLKITTVSSAVAYYESIDDLIRCRLVRRNVDQIHIFHCPYWSTIDQQRRRRRHFG